MISAEESVGAPTIDKNETPVYSSAIIRESPDVPQDDTHCHVKKIVLKINAGLEANGVVRKYFENGRPVRIKL